MVAWYVFCVPHSLGCKLHEDVMPYPCGIRRKRHSACNTAGAQWLFIELINKPISVPHFHSSLCPWLPPPQLQIHSVLPSWTKPSLDSRSHPPLLHFYLVFFDIAHKQTIRACRCLIPTTCYHRNLVSPCRGCWHHAVSRLQGLLSPKPSIRPHLPADEDPYLSLLL